MFAIAVLGGFVVSALATGPNQIRAAEPGEPTYRLTDLKVEFPYVGPDGVVDETKAGVTYDIAWSTDTYPGSADCELRVLDADGAVIGSFRNEFMNLQPEVLDVDPVPVPVGGVPASAEASCGAARAESGNYTISNPTVVTSEDGTQTIVADITFGDGERPGVGACTASLTLPNGERTDWPFTLQAAEGRMVIAFLGSGFDGASVESVSCGPYTTADALVREAVE